LKLLEYEAKRVFAEYGIPIPQSSIASTTEEAETIAKNIGGSVVIKAQLPIGGRGKAGGIKFAENPEKASLIAKDILNSKFKGLKVNKVLVEKKIDILEELYLGITVDRTKRSYVFLVSSEGGVDIEEIAEKNPEKIIRHPIDPLYGFREYHSRLLAKRLGFSGREMTALSRIIMRLYSIAVGSDAELTEINPLALTPEGFVAVDARLNIDDNALFRHPKLVEDRESREGLELSSKEIRAREKGLAYVELEGNIGVIGNGAGLTMATLDTIALYGGKPANFLDLGGGATTERIEAGVLLVLSDEKVDSLFVNILGGITRCDYIARGIIQARRRLSSIKPIVVRMMGTNEEEGRRLLKQDGIDTYETMEEAAKEAVRLAMRDS
jgi:succinyl-CoA synthetase beta subunit